MKRLLFIILLLPCLVYGQTVGIKVASPIIKNSPSDNTVTGYADLLNGGYHIVPTISGRDSLNTAYSKTLKTGMLCYVTGVDSTYRWDGSTWIVQGAGNVTLSQLTDSLSNYTPLQDGLISGGSATIGTGSVTIDTAYYRINKANKMSLPRTFTGIANSASGTQYYILVYGKSDNTLDTLQGVQDTIAVIPTKPNGTVNINTVLVGDGGVVSTSPDLTGYVTTNTSQLINGAKTFTNVTNFKQNINLDSNQNIGFFKGGLPYLHNYRGSLNLGKNTFLGIGAGNFNSDNQTYASTGIGYMVLSKNTQGRSNVAVGDSVLAENLTGSGNTAVGTLSNHFNTHGYSNSSLGWHSMLNNTTGHDNTAIGVENLRTNTTGYNNIALGNGAGYSNNGHDNLFLGHNSGYTYTGDNHLFIANNYKTLIEGDFNTSQIYLNGVTQSSDLTIKNDVTAPTLTFNRGAISSSILFDDITTGSMIYNSNSSGGHIFRAGGSDKFTINNAGILTLLTSPISSSSVFDVLTRNTSTGEVEKVGSSYFQKSLTNPITGIGLSRYLSVFSSDTTLTNSTILYDSGTNFGINTATPPALFTVKMSSSDSNGGMKFLGFTYPSDINYWSETELALQYNGVYRNVFSNNGFSFLNGGRVGIGTSTDDGINQLQVNGNTIASSFIKSGGTSSQFLKADGSSDSNTYLTSSTGVSSITGTSNQVVASASTGAVTLSLPQSIATSSTPQFGGLGIGASSSSTTFFNTSAGTTAKSSFRIPNGVAPTSPVSGDWWSLTTGLRTQTYDGTQTKDVIFDKVNNVFAGYGVGAIVTDNSGNLSVAPSADRTLSNKLSKTSNYTVTLSDFGANGELVLEVNATSGAVTITLPSLANMTGVKLMVWKTDSSGNSVTISGAVNINGSSTASLATQWASTTITGGTSVYLAK